MGILLTLSLVASENYSVLVLAVFDSRLKVLLEAEVHQTTEVNSSSLLPGLFHDGAFASDIVKQPSLPVSLFLPLSSHSL